MQSLTQEPRDKTSESKKVQVWLRPLGKTCKVRVGNRDDASWFRVRLEDAGIQCSKVTPIAGIEQAVFRIALHDEMTFSELQSFIERIPDVRIMLDPA